MPSADDADVAAVRAGDGAAFGRLVARHQRTIRAFAVARCPPGGDADEVAQTVFVEAFRRLGDYRPGTNLRAWLFAIARYQLMAEATRLRRHADYHSRYVPHALGRELDRRLEEERTATGAGEPPRLAALRACLERLDDAARVVLDLRYAEGLPLEVIGERTGRTTAGVKKKLHALRGRLHECVRRGLAAEGLR